MRYEEEFEDAKQVIRNRKSKKDIHCNGQKKGGTIGQIMIYQTLHRKLRI